MAIQPEDVHVPPVFRSSALALGCSFLPIHINGEATGGGSSAVVSAAHGRPVLFLALTQLGAVPAAAGICNRLMVTAYLSICISSEIIKFKKKKTMRKYKFLLGRW